jgi:hypothetical protein
MSQAYERYLHYFLEQVRFHTEDWHWFVLQWPQIDRVWELSQRYLPDAKAIIQYTLAFYPFQNQRGLWGTAVIWLQHALSLIDQAKSEPLAAVILNQLGTAHRHLGAAQQAVTCHERALQIRRGLGDVQGGSKLPE